MDMQKDEQQMQYLNLLLNLARTINLKSLDEMIPQELLKNQIREAIDKTWEGPSSYTVKLAGAIWGGDDETPVFQCKNVGTMQELFDLIYPNVQYWCKSEVLTMYYAAQQSWKVLGLDFTQPVTRVYAIANATTGDIATSPEYTEFLALTRILGAVFKEIQDTTEDTFRRLHFSVVIVASD